MFVGGNVLVEASRVVVADGLMFFGASDALLEVRRHCSSRNKTVDRKRCLVRVRQILRMRGRVSFPSGRAPSLRRRMPFARTARCCRRHGAVGGRYSGVRARRRVVDQSRALLMNDRSVSVSDRAVSASRNALSLRGGMYRRRRTEPSARGNIVFTPGSATPDSGGSASRPGRSIVLRSHVRVTRAASRSRAAVLCF